MICRRRCWLSLAMLLLVSVTFAAIWRLEHFRRIWADLYRLASDAPKVFTVLAAPPLLLLFFVLWALLERNGGRAGLWSELDSLLQRKRKGLLRRAAQRIRGSTAQSGHNAAPTDRAIHVLQTPRSSPAAGMDRLVQQKRCGAWSPSPSKVKPAPTTEHGQAPD
jgi:hypothetical protein